MDGPRVLITGAAGLLGTWLRRTVPAGVTVVPLMYRRSIAGDSAVAADLRDPDAAAAAFAHARPDVVIHAAYAHDEASIVAATRHVAAATLASGADLVQISTDVVFSGDGAPRREQDAPDPVSDYGRWKARAEQIVTEASPAAAVVRLPLVVSLEPEDHVIAQIRAGIAAGRPTVWFDDEYRQPAYGAEIARALWKIAELERTARAGAWHLPGPERLTRAEIAQRIVAALGFPTGAIGTASSPSAPPRPRDIHMLDGRARAAIGWAPAPVLVR